MGHTTMPNKTKYEV